MTFGSPTKARARTTRCFWPPDRFTALLFALSASSSWPSTASARALRSRRPTPAIFSGSITLSRTVAFGVRKNCWKTNPKSRFRIRLSCRVDSAEASAPPTCSAPPSGSSSSASRCIRVDFPDPLLPTIATDSPASILSETPDRASKRVVPRP
jgi:hypothetical protein